MNQMFYQENKALGLPLSRLSFGGAALSGEGGGYGFGALSELEAERLLKYGWDHGINIYDTAPIYGFGLSEERLGRYLPKEAIVISKGGVDWHSNRRVNMTNDPIVIERMFYESLKRLNREYINVYMVHWPDPKVDIRRPMEVLVRLQEKGLIQSLGLCNTHLEDLNHAEEIGKIQVIQSELNLFNTQPFQSLNEEWKKRFSLSWGTLDKGILSGRVTSDRKFSKEDCRSWAPWWNRKEVAKKILKVEELKAILLEENISLARFCLNFNLYYFGISSCLIGFKSEKDIVEMSVALQEPISGEKIEEVLKRWE